MSSTMRRAIVLVLVAACGTLVLPCVAGAQVRAKHRAEYRNTVKNLDTMFGIWAQAFDNARQASIDQATTMMGTTDHDLLLLYEQNAMSVYTANLGRPAEWNVSYARMVNAFKAKAKRSFAAASQQRAFKTRCDRLKAYAGMLILPANTHVYDSLKELGTDPPDYITSAAMIGFADEDAAAGHEGFDKNRAALNAMP